MMRIETSRFGPLEMDERVFIHFPWGIPGFESVKRYVLMQHRDGPFHWLQAVDDPELAFLVCPPEVLGLQYQVPQAKMKMLHLQQAEDLTVLIMVIGDRERQSIRPHLQGPLIFNATSRIGFQWTLDAEEVADCVKRSEDPGTDTAATA